MAAPPARPPADSPRTTATGQGTPGQDAKEQGAREQGVLVYPAAFFAGSKPDTAFDMIARLPGFTLDIGAQDTRGLAGTAGNVLVDGARPSSKSDTLDLILARIAAASVDRIELIRGAAPGIDMRGRAVVANVVLKPMPKAQFVLEPNFYAYRDGFFGPFLKGSYTRREGERQTEASLSATTDRTGDTAQGRRTRTDASGARIQDAGLDLVDHYQTMDARGAIQRPLWGGKLHANAVFDYTQRHDVQAVTVESGSGADEFTDEHSRNPTGELGFTWTRAPGPRATFELTGLQRLGHVDYSGASDSAGRESVFTSATTSGESVVRATNLFRASDRLSLEGGGEVAYNFLKSVSSYTQDGVAVPLPNAGIAVTELRGEGFARATWHPAPKLTVEGEMRVELSRIDETGDTSKARSFVYPKPRLQLTWSPGAGNQVRLRVEKEVGQLDFSDFAASSEISLGNVIGGNADLRPQRATVVEAVYERRFWKKGVLELTARHSALVDVVDSIPLAGGIDAVGNIGDGTSDLAQVTLTLPFDRLGLKDGLLRLNGTWSWSRVTDPLTGERRPLSQQIPFDCDVRFNQDVKGGRYAFGFEHGCNANRFRSYRTAEVRVARYDPFVSIYAQWKPSDRLSLRIDLGNVLDARTQGLRDIYAGPRNLATVRYREDRTTRRGQYLYVQIRRVL